jgi:hypothetical protein
MMTNALKAIEDYRSRTGALHSELNSTVETLLSSSFSGAAADGFGYFYRESIDKAIGENLTGLLNALQEIVDETLKAIPGGDGVDDQLGEGNRQ